jgi:hypothetical protein
MLTHEYTKAYAAVGVDSGELDTHTLPHDNGEYIKVFIVEVSIRHANDHIVMVLDGTQAKRSKHSNSDIKQCGQSPGGRGVLMHY